MGVFSGTVVAGWHGWRDVPVVAWMNVQNKRFSEPHHLGGFQKVHEKYHRVILKGSFAFFCYPDKFATTREKRGARGDASSVLVLARWFGGPVGLCTGSV